MCTHVPYTHTLAFETFRENDKNHSFTAETPQENRQDNTQETSAIKDLIKPRELCGESGTYA